MTHTQALLDLVAFDRQDAVDAMYRTPLPASRSGPLYNAFSYPTKISPEVIALFIATHTQPGDRVLDAFAGSGTTGLATLLCDRPTDEMRRLADRLGVSPTWGPRRADLVDVGTLGCFIARVMTSPPDSHEFRQAAERLVESARDRIGSLYQAEDDRGEIGEIRHVIWSEVVSCTSCAGKHRTWDVAVSRDPAAFLSSFVCPSCGGSERLDACERVTSHEEDVFGRPVTGRLRVPVEVHGVTGNRKWRRPANPADRHLDGWRDVDLPDCAPDVPIQWGELHRAGYHSGIEHLHHFYTPRNFTALAVCMELASAQPEPMASALRFLVLSYNASHATLMTRIVAKKGQSDFVLTGAQSGVLYVSGLPVEKNVLRGVERKAKVIANAFEVIGGSRSKVSVHNASSEKLPIADGVIDYLFTDPPFGDYIPYAELNQINELWLDATTDRAAETVVSVSGGKDADHYETSMARVFGEVARVLKDDGRATVVFHSAKARIWQALTRAYTHAGFAVARTSVLDKIQASFKQVVSTVSVKGDPLILLKKGATTEMPDVGDAMMGRIERDFRSSGATDIRPFYSRYVAESLEAGLPVALDARTFAARLSNGRAIG